MKVLIADDSEMIRNGLVRLLSSVECVGNIFEARDVEEAKYLIDSINPDIMIIDIRMPGGSGFDVLEKVHSEGRDSVMIVLTNYPNEQFRRKSMSLGARYFFDKTIDFNKIKDICRQFAINEELAAAFEN